MKFKVSYEYCHTRNTQSIIGEINGCRTIQDIEKMYNEKTILIVLKYAVQVRQDEGCNHTRFTQPKTLTVTMGDILIPMNKIVSIEVVD